MIINRDVVQGSQEWFACRCGIPSASNFDKIITTKGEPSKSAEKYLYQLVGERITGKKEEGYTNGNMLRGVELEEEARNFYELLTGDVVEQVGCCYADEKKLFSCSPDGLVLAKRKGVEIKCPTMAVHVGYLLGGNLPTDYFQQVHGSLLICRDEIDMWDFMSYFPGMPPFLITVNHDFRFQSRLTAELGEFCERLSAVEKLVRDMA